MNSIIDGQNNACVVATQIKKASSKKGMNAGKFTGKFFWILAMSSHCNVISILFQFYLERGPFQKNKLKTNKQGGIVPYEKIGKRSSEMKEVQII